MRNAGGDVLALFFFVRVLSRAIDRTLPYFFLPAMGLCGAFASASVGVGALTANREVPAMTQAAVTTEIHETLDVHLNFAAQVAFDGEVGVDVLADGEDFCVGQLVYTTGLCRCQRRHRCFWQRCSQCR